MLERILTFFREATPGQLARSALDVAIVYYIAYRTLLVLRGTRAMQVGAGLAAVFLLYIVAQRLQLVTVESILGALLSSIILVMVVVFQDDIRRGLQRVGQKANFGWARTQESQIIEAVVDAATELARHRMGAIIVIERDANVDEFVDQNNRGQELDAVVSNTLLVSLFVPEGMNRLHDGAAIIRNARIAKAGVFFRMPDARLDAAYGSRHRAALGITQDIDAIAVVVSEERGLISMCVNGNIIGNLPGPKLRAALEDVLLPKPKRKKTEPAEAPADEAPASARVSPTDEPPPVSIRVQQDSTPEALKTPPPLRARPSEPPAEATPKPLRALADSEPDLPVAKKAAKKKRKKADDDAPTETNETTATKPAKPKKTKTEPKKAEPKKAEPKKTKQSAKASKDSANEDAEPLKRATDDADGDDVSSQPDANPAPLRQQVPLPETGRISLNPLKQGTPLQAAPPPEERPPPGADDLPDPRPRSDSNS